MMRTWALVWRTEWSGLGVQGRIDGKILSSGTGGRRMRDDLAASRVGAGAGEIEGGEECDWGRSSLPGWALELMLMERWVEQVWLGGEG
jgi:hypothetical protein